MNDLVSTKQAMSILGVGSSTIKRWANDGTLDCTYTAGGHRRFNRKALEALVGTTPQPEDSELLSIKQWVKNLTQQQDIAVTYKQTLALNQLLGNWYRTADFLGRALEEIGNQWADDGLSVLEEHIASQLISSSLIAAASNIEVSESAPTCLLATLTGERHCIGLFLTQVCLRASGYQTILAGADTPLSELIAATENLKPNILALSASRWSTDEGTLNRTYKQLASVCKNNSIELVIGGSGAWPNTVDYGHRCKSYEDLKAVVNTQPNK